MSTADKWADPRAVGGGTVQSKAKERTELAKKWPSISRKTARLKPPPPLCANHKKRLSKTATKRKAGEG